MFLGPSIGFGLILLLVRTGPEKVRNITDMYTDSFFSYGVYSFINQHIKHARQATHQPSLYRFLVIQG
jgi:hypothetical protein